MPMTYSWRFILLWSPTHVCNNLPFHRSIRKLQLFDGRLMPTNYDSHCVTCQYASCRVAGVPAKSFPVEPPAVPQLHGPLSQCHQSCNLSVGLRDWNHWTVNQEPHRSERSVKICTPIVVRIVLIPFDCAT